MARARLARLVRPGTHTTTMGTTIVGIRPSRRVVKWVKVPSRVQVSGNEEAESSRRKDNSLAPLPTTHPCTL